MGKDNAGTAERVIDDPTESEFAVLAIYRAVLNPLIAPDPIRPNPTTPNVCLQFNSKALGNTDLPTMVAAIRPSVA
jgi:hypothetical protein